MPDRRPEIWLQWDDEARGTADCGCELVQKHKGSGAALFYCATHAAAPDLLAALELALRYLEHPDVLAVTQRMALPGSVPADRARAAIAKAKQASS